MRYWVPATPLVPHKPGELHVPAIGLQPDSDRAATWRSRRLRHVPDAVSGHSDNSRRVLIDFTGGDLDTLGTNATGQAADSAPTMADVDNVSVQRLSENGVWRVSFRITPKGDKPRRSALLLDFVRRSPHGDLDLSMDTLKNTGADGAMAPYARRIWRRAAFFTLTFLTAFCGRLPDARHSAHQRLRPARADRPGRCSWCSSSGCRAPSGPQLPASPYPPGGPRSGSAASGGRSAASTQGPHGHRLAHLQRGHGARVRRPRCHLELTRQMPQAHELRFLRALGHAPARDRAARGARLARDWSSAMAPAAGSSTAAAPTTSAARPATSPSSCATGVARTTT